jgi:hypothetical protein
MIAADTGIWSGKFTLADVLFLIAVIVFALATVFAVVKPLAVELALIAGGLTAVALGLLVI